MDTILLIKQDIAGKYVALETRDSDNIICSGNSSIDVYNEAVKKGIPSPVIIYIPEKNLINIY